MKKKLFCFLLSFATCACLAFGVGCEKNTEQGGNGQNSEADAPVYLGMSIENSALQTIMPMSFSPSLSVWAQGDEIYYSRPNRDIDITIHFDNPKQFEIMSFTLNEKKYAVNMFEKGSDLENIILKVSVGDFDEVTEYTIDATKYIDGEAIRDVRIGGDKTVKLYREYEIDYHDDYDANLPEEYTILSDTITLSELSRTGYTFEGWFEDKAYTKKIESIEKGSKGDRDIYAKWTVIDYTITYHLDGGTNGENPESYTVEDKVVLQKAEKTGYTFEGWYEDEAFTKKAESFENATGDKQLYAKWKLVDYQINYHLNGGENSSENPLSYTVDDAVAFKQAEKRGYTFEGWYEDEACTEKIEGIEKGSKGDRDIYAKWEIVTYKIEYVLDGGTNDDNPTSYTVEDKVELKYAKKRGYFFFGWYKDEEHKELVTELENMTGDLKLYAWWVEGTEGLSFEEVEGGYAVTGYEEESEIVVIPDKYIGGKPVIEIGYRAFFGCDSVKSITIPSSVMTIRNGAFLKCPALKNVTLSDGVISIEEEAFYGCESLESITIPSGVTSIEKSTFYNCISLIEVTLPDGLKSIGDEAFRFCEKLESIIIPDSVTKIGHGAFFDCYRLVEVVNFSHVSDGGWEYALDVYDSTNFESKIKKQDDFVFYEKGGVSYLIDYLGDKTEITLPEGFQGKSYGIREYAFYNKKALKSVIISDGVTSIGKCAFMLCFALERVEISDSVTEIGIRVFEGTALTEIHYNGTIAAWARIEFKVTGDYETWNLYSSITKVICADGDEIELDKE